MRQLNDMIEFCHECPTYCGQPRAACRVDTLKTCITAMTAGGDPRSVRESVSKRASVHSDKVPVFDDSSSSRKSRYPYRWNWASRIMPEARPSRSRSTAPRSAPASWRARLSRGRKGCRRPFAAASICGSHCIPGTSRLYLYRWSAATMSNAIRADRSQRHFLPIHYVVTPLSSRSCSLASGLSACGDGRAQFCGQDAGTLARIIDAFITVSFGASYEPRREFPR